MLKIHGNMLAREPQSSRVTPGSRAAQLAGLRAAPGSMSALLTMEDRIEIMKFWPLGGSFSPVWAATIARVGAFFSILEIYRIYNPLHRSDLKISAKNSSNFWWNEQISFHFIPFFDGLGYFSTKISFKFAGNSRKCF